MELLAKVLSTATDNTKAVAKPTRLASRPSTLALTITKLSTSSNLSRTKVSMTISVPDNVLDNVPDINHSIDGEQSSSSSSTMDTLKAASTLITLVVVDNEHHRRAANYHPRSLPEE
jgi:hypothetical protein